MDVLLMCRWGKSALMFLWSPNWDSGELELVLKAVDRCIAREVSDLNSRGIITSNSCCGHRKGEPDAVIYKSSIPQAQKLGYTVSWLPVGNPLLHIREEVP